MKRRAIIGDVHGTIDEFKELYARLEWLSLDEICSVGDLVDRGPDSGACVQFAKDKNILTVKGNHEDSILNLWDKKVHHKKEKDSHNHKLVTLSQMNDERIEWMRALPKLHVFDDSGLVLVHGGLFPGMPLYAQPHNVIRAQLIHPYKADREGDIRWWGADATKHKSKKTEEESRAEGYVRWYEVYDGAEDVVYGHSVFVQPFIHQNKGKGRTIGIDTGNVFGGVLTAVVHGEKDLFFISVPPKKVYCEDKQEKFKPR